jgi:subtilisin-like proprotein convertase family protein
MPNLDWSTSAPNANSAGLSHAPQGELAVGGMFSRLNLGQSGASHRTSLLFVDQGIADYQSLIAGQDLATEVYLLSPGQDSLAQITETLLQYQQQGQLVSSLQIASHGQAGALALGAQQVNADTLLANQGLLQSWQGLLSEGADILLYGCNVGQGETGQAFVRRLAELTQADVAASDDYTGSQALGGDWDLEVEYGVIESALALDSTTKQLYAGLLDTASFTNSNGIDSPFTLNTLGYDRLNTSQKYSSINIANLAGNITDLTVEIKDLRHSRTASLDILLVSPTGTHSILLMSDIGIASGSGGTNDPIDLTFSDSATAELGGNLVGTSSVTSGTYKPKNRSGDTSEDFTSISALTTTLTSPTLRTALSSFDGISANGDWKLYIFNDTLQGQTGSDGSIASWTLNITTDSTSPINTIPTVSNFSASGTVGTPIQFQLSDFSSRFMDVDGDSLSQIRITELPAVGTLKLNGVSVVDEQVITASALNGLTYDGPSGSSSFQWTASDGQGFATSPATVSLTLNSGTPVVNVNAPILTGNVVKSGLQEDAPYTFQSTDFTSKFSDPDSQSLDRIKILSLPSHGILWLGTQKLAINSEVNIGNLNTIRYEPNANFSGDDSFSWNASDGVNYAQTSSKVNLTFNNTADAPTLTNFNRTVSSRSSLLFREIDFTQAFRSLDLDAQLGQVQLTSLPTRGTLSLNNQVLTTPQTIARADLSKLVYKPTVTSGIDQFTWRAVDSNGVASAADKDSLVELWIARPLFLRGSLITTRR